MDEKQPEKGLKTCSEAGSGEKISDNERLLWRMIQRFGAEKTDSAIVTEVLGFTGERYSKGKDLLERLRDQFGG